MVAQGREGKKEQQQTKRSQSRNFRDAVMGSKKPDRAMELLRAHVLSKFVIPPSDLSHAEIVSRQGRAVFF